MHAIYVVRSELTGRVTVHTCLVPWHFVLDSLNVSVVLLFLTVGLLATVVPLERGEDLVFDS